MPEGGARRLLCRGVPLPALSDAYAGGVGSYGGIVLLECDVYGLDLGEVAEEASGYAGRCVFDEVGGDVHFRADGLVGFGVVDGSADVVVVDGGGCDVEGQGDVEGVAGSDDAFLRFQSVAGLELQVVQCQLCVHVCGWEVGPRVAAYYPQREAPQFLQMRQPSW